MRFVFLSTNKISKYLYLVGIPVLLIPVFDQLSLLYMNQSYLSDKLRLQMFIVSAIIISLASVLNLGFFIVKSLFKPLFKQ